MRIESIIRRQDGSTVTLGDKTYKFTVGDDGFHVCEVEDPAHIERLLSIKEGFRAASQAQAELPDLEPVAVEQPEPVAAAPVAPKATKQTRKTKG